MFVKKDTSVVSAGVMGAVLAAKGAAWGLGVGILLHLVLRDFTTKKAVIAESDKNAIV